MRIVSLFRRKEQSPEDREKEKQELADQRDPFRVYPDQRSDPSGESS